MPVIHTTYWSDMKKQRNIMPARDKKERTKSFGEVALGYDEEMAVDEAVRCLQCKNAPCKNGCPVGVNIPEFIQKIKERRFDEAHDIIKATNNLPAVCGRVCPQEEQCEKLCVRARMEGSVAIGALERFAADFGLEHKTEQKRAKITVNKRVAVVGSGPAGLTVAADCAAAGLDVIIYEAFHKPGGVLTYGIPEFRLPKRIVKAEIDNLIALGVKLELNTIVGKTVLIEDLLDEYDAVFIGSGAGLPVFLSIKGENLNRVFSANEYLTRVNLMGAYLSDSDTPIITGKKVAIIGAGNVALDAARTALRLGSEEVSIIYRRSRAEMPARAEEIEHAEEEGLIFRLLTNPIEITSDNGRVNGLKCRKCELGEPDTSGRRTPVEVPGSDFVMECDLVIIAIGTSPNPLITKSYDKLKTTRKGTLLVDESLMTSVENVYAGGDAVTGAATVILAMGAGKKAAKAIIDKLIR